MGKEKEVDYKKAFYFVMRSLSKTQSDMRERCPSFGRSCCGMCKVLEMNQKKYKKMIKKREFDKDGSN